MAADTATAESGAGVAGAAPRLRFGAFVLDQDRGLLLGADGAPVPLRPKTWAMLLHFAANAGRVVEREALLDAIWPGVTVTDESVTQCVAELRRALGDEGARWLRTVPRRGYVFEAELVADAPAPAEAEAPRPGLPAPPAAEPAAPPAARPRQPPRRALLAVGVAATGLALGALLWPRPAHLPPLAANPQGENARDTAMRLYREGLAALDRASDRGGHWLAAREKFMRAIDVDPSFAQAYAQAVYTHTNMVVNGHAADPDADLRAADRLVQRLLQLQPNAWYTYNAQAALLRVQGRHAEALAAYRRVESLNATVLPPRANIGLMLVLLGRAQEAIAPIRATIALAPASHPFQPTWQAYLGVALLHAGQEDFGVEAFRLARGDRALLPGALQELHLAAALALKGELEEAQATIRALRTRDPGLTQAGLRAAPMSSDPAYLAQREALFRGLALASLP